MKIEIELSEERYELLKHCANKIEISVDAYVNLAIYEQLRKNGVFGKNSANVNHK